MGGLVGQPRLAARAGCCSPATSDGEHRRLAARSTPTMPRCSQRLRELAARRAGLRSRSSASALGAPASVEPAARRRRRSWRPPRFDRAARPALAADLLHRHHRRARTTPCVTSEPEEPLIAATSRPAPDAAAGGSSRRRRRRRPPSPLAGDAGRGRRSGRSCTACWRRPTSPPPTSRPSWRPGSPRSVRRAVDVGDPQAVVGGPARGDRDAARARARRPAPARRRPRRPARRARVRAAARRRRPAQRHGSTLSRIAGVLREHLPADDPLAATRDRLGDPALRQSVRGYLTGSLDLRRPRLPRTAALCGGRLQDQLARAPRASR